MSELEKRSVDRASARFEEVFDAHYADLLSYALRRAGDRETAEDVVAETFGILWLRGAEAPAEPLPWLYGVARRVLANQRRSQRRRWRLFDRLSSEAGPSAQLARDPADAVDGRDAVLTAFARLSETSREVLRLISWEGLSSKAAAEALGCTETALRLRLFRARRQLSAELEGEHVTSSERTSTEEAV